MTRFVVEIDEVRHALVGDPIDISIPLYFDGLQPGFYNTVPATARPMHSGEFIGDTRLGGSCNADHIDMITHCNGTHTECVGHLTIERVGVRELATDPLYRCNLLSVEIVRAGQTGEQGGPIRQASDWLITRAALACAMDALGATTASALAIRTLPNPRNKITRHYGDAETPYFTVEAMQWIVAQGVTHLLVDTPSVDRLDDGGRLTAHRIFWGMKPGSRSVDDATRADATITELIYVPDQVADGPYLLDLQLAPFASDAAPSRPLLHAYTS